MPKSSDEVQHRPYDSLTYKRMLAHMNKETVLSIFFAFLLSNDPNELKQPYTGTGPLDFMEDWLGVQIEKENSQVLIEVGEAIHERVDSSAFYADLFARALHRKDPKLQARVFEKVAATAFAQAIQEPPCKNVS